MTRREIIIAVCALGVIVSAWLLGSRHGQRVALEQETRTDTVTRIVTVYKDFPQPQKSAITGQIAVPAYKFIADTIKRVETREITLHDTTIVFLPREQKYYEEADGRLRLWVSGYDPMLDRWELDERETTVTRTVLPRRWSIGITAGYGAAIHDKTVMLSPFVGVGVNYAIFSF